MARWGERSSQSSGRRNGSSSSRGWLLCALALGALGAPANAAVRLGLGADYQVGGTGLYHLTLAVDGAVARSLTVGGRFGALIRPPDALGVPLDLVVRASLANDRVYLEGLAGPWIFLGGVRAHTAFGFGLQGRAVAAGLELGWLDPSPMLGLRLAWRI